MSHGSENLKILYVLITAPWNCLIGRRETNLEIENSSGVCQKVIYMLKCLCYEETSDIVKSSHLHINLMLEDEIWIKDLKEKKCVEQVWDMSGASSGACVRYVLGIIWGMFGTTSGAYCQQWTTIRGATCSFWSNIYLAVCIVHFPVICGFGLN